MTLTRTGVYSNSSMVNDMYYLPFKGILAVKPYTLEKSTEEWRELPLRSVHFYNLWLTRDSLDINTLFGGHDKKDASADRVPHVVRLGKALYLDSGHHLVIPWAIKGIQMTYARIYTLETPK